MNIYERMLMDVMPDGHTMIVNSAVLENGWAE